MYTPTRIAQILSHKRLRNNDASPEIPTLEDYNCLIDEPILDVLLNDTSISELQATYELWTDTTLVPPSTIVARLLNGLVQNCDRICSKITDGPRSNQGFNHFTIQEIEKRWPSNLRFMEVDNDTGSPGEKIRPSIAGVIGIKQDAPSSGTSYSYWWGITQHPLDKQIVIPVALGSIWTEIYKSIILCIEDGQIEESPLRRLAMAIGVNIKERSLIFILNYPGGYCTSPFLHFGNSTNIRDMQRIMLSICLWQSRVDAGLPSLYSSRPLHFPAPFKGDWMLKKFISIGPLSAPRRTYVTQMERIPHSADNETGSSRLKSIPGPSIFLDPVFPYSTVIFDEKEGPNLLSKLTSIVVKYSWQPIERERYEANMLRASSGAFGAPVHILSFRACDSYGHPLTNGIFVGPKKADTASESGPNTGPKFSGYRALWVTVTAEEGGSLLECSNETELRICLSHALLGWFSAYRHGYLHRDIAQDNIITLSPTNSLPRQSLNSDVKLDPLAYGSSAIDMSPELEQLTRDLSELLSEKREFFETCQATFIDSDMCSFLPEDALKARLLNKAKIFFKAYSILSDLKWGVAYHLDIPLEDIESFVRVALCTSAEIGRKSEGGPYLFDAEISRMMDDDRFDKDKTELLRELSMADGESESNESKKYSPVLRKMGPLLATWCIQLDQLSLEYRLESTTLYEKSESDELLKHQLSLFHKYTYKGVILSLRILLEGIKKDHAD